jgi:hypothetical protein
MGRERRGGPPTSFSYNSTTALNILIYFQSAIFASYGANLQQLFQLMQSCIGNYKVTGHCDCKIHLNSPTSICSSLFFGLASARHNGGKIGEKTKEKGRRRERDFDANSSMHGPWQPCIGQVYCLGYSAKYETYKLCNKMHFS